MKNILGCLVCSSFYLRVQRGMRCLFTIQEVIYDVLILNYRIIMLLFNWFISQSDTKYIEFVYNEYSEKAIAHCNTCVIQPFLILFLISVWKAYVFPFLHSFISPKEFFDEILSLKGDTRRNWHLCLSIVSNERKKPH